MHQRKLPIQRRRRLSMRNQMQLRRNFSTWDCDCNLSSNTKMGYDNILFRSVIEKHGFGDRIDNGEGLTDSCRVRHLYLVPQYLSTEAAIRPVCFRLADNIHLIWLTISPSISLEIQNDHFHRKTVGRASSRHRIKEPTCWPATSTKNSWLDLTLVLLKM